MNKTSGNGKVALTPHEIKGCTGVSRRYAYELMDAIGEIVDGVRVREADPSSSKGGSARKGKALHVDCELLRNKGSNVSSFTTNEMIG
jgi:hypothetical protein